jgi:cation-transporting ATPase 13A3/4/5
MEQPQQPLLQNSKNCTIRNSDVEGQCKVLSITPIRLSKDRVGLGVLISLVTALLFALACSWSKRLTKKFFFQNCRLDDATHFWILNEDKSFNIVKRITTSNSISFFNRKLRYIYCQEQSVF